MSSNAKLAMLGALFLALAIAALGLFSSIVAWRLGNPAFLGRPLYDWWLYNPLAVLAWHRKWGWSPAIGQAWIIAGLLVLIPLAGAAMMMTEDGPDPDEPKPNRGLGKPSDLKATGHIAAKGNGVVIGKTGISSILRDGGDGHIAAFGPARSGKGAGIVVPTLLSHRGPIFCHDIKPELFEVAGRFRATLGPVHAFNPATRRSSRYNPLLELSIDESLFRNCNMVGAMLANAGKLLGSTGDPHWENSAAYLFSGMIFHVRLSGDPTLAHAWRLLQGIAAGRWPKATHKWSYDILESVKAKDSKERSGIISTAITALRFMNDPIVQYATSESDFMASDLACSPEPMTLFYGVPAMSIEAYAGLSRLVLQMIATSIMHNDTFTMDGRRKLHTVLALWDEFAACGYLPVVDKAQPLSAGLGLRFALVTQDPSQVIRHYGSHQSITTNCSTHVVLPGFSEESLKIIAGWAGRHATVRKSKSRPSTGWGGKGGTITETVVTEPTLDPGKMLERSGNEVVVFTLGCKPTYLRKVRYWQERCFMGLWDDPKGRKWDAPDPLVMEAPPEEPEPLPEPEAKAAPRSATLRERIKRAAGKRKGKKPTAPSPALPAPSRPARGRPRGSGSAPPLPLP